MLLSDCCLEKLNVSVNLLIRTATCYCQTAAALYIMSLSLWTEIVSAYYTENFIDFQIFSPDSYL
jgi:hypothetical protein